MSICYDTAHLKPCPFCGASGDALHLAGIGSGGQPTEYNGYICCRKCGAELTCGHHVTDGLAMREVARKWNDRAPVLDPEVKQFLRQVTLEWYERSDIDDPDAIQAQVDKLPEDEKHRPLLAWGGLSAVQYVKELRQVRRAPDAAVKALETL